jgi:hypothetical protein
MIAQIIPVVVALGVFLRIGDWLVAPGAPDAVIRVAWSLTLSLVVAGLTLLAIPGMVYAYGPAEAIVVTVFSLGVLGGLGYGLWATRWRSPAVGTRRFRW